MKTIFKAAVLLAFGISNIALSKQIDFAPSIIKQFVKIDNVAPNGNPINGILSIPKQIIDTKLPAVIILHGSAGPDSRGTLHATDLLLNGIATLEIDMWSARGLTGGANSRPKTVQETLPDLSSALLFLAHNAKIDANRIGGLGFSWGGAMLMLASDETFGSSLQQISNVSIKGSAIFYPVCWGYNKIKGYPFKTIVDTKVLVLTGAKDGYDDDPNTCTNLVTTLSEKDQSKIKVISYPNATHGFNMLEKKVVFNDGFAHQGKGGETISEPNPLAREQSRTAVIQFFRQLFNISK